MYTVYIKLEKSWTESNRKSKATKNGNTRWHIHRQYAMRQQVEKNYNELHRQQVPCSSVLEACPCVSHNSVVWIVQ